MKQRIVQVLQFIRVRGLLIALLCTSSPGFANPYTNPSAPFSFGAATQDIVTINASYPAVTGFTQQGTMATTTSAAFTVNLSTITTGTGSQLSISAGATVDYLGLAAGTSISSQRSDPNTTTDTIDISGKVACTNGNFAISLINTSGTSADSHIINVNAGASVTSGIFTSGTGAVTLAPKGSGTATITGAIDLATRGNNSSLALSGGITYSSANSWTNINSITVDATSTLSLNNLSTSIGSNNIAINGGTFNINYDLNSSAGVVAGNITNTGTINIGANVYMSGTFTGSGSNVATAGQSTGLTVKTSSYAVTNHVAQLANINSYGNINLSTASYGCSNFTARYTGGYFPSGTYTLLTSPNNITLVNPSITNTATSLFVNFGTPALSSNNKSVVISATRTPYNSVAQTALTQYIGANLEAIGGSNPNSDMVTLLNAVEQSQSAGALTNNLQQLAPLMSAPLYGIQIQNDSLQQVQLRLASLRDGTSYVAGDIGKENYLWMRGFGSFANQKATGDTLGFYGTGGGYAFGFDRNLDEKYTVGCALVYALANVRDKINLSSFTKSKSYIGIGYGSYNFSDIEYLDWMVSVAANNFVATRNINFNNYKQIAQSTYGTQQYSAKLLLGKNIASFGFMILTPESSAQYTFSKQYSTNEYGANGANLNVDRANSNLLTLGLGGRAAIPIATNPGIWMPDAHFMALYNIISGRQNLMFTFLGGGGQVPMVVLPSRIGIVYGLGLNIAASDNIEVKFNFDIERTNTYKSHSIYMNLRYLL